MNRISDKSRSMAQALTEEIIGGVYRAGMRLPGERTLSEYFKVSRITTRGVLNNFENTGVIVRKARRGAFIADDAVELLERREVSSTVHIVFIMPPGQQTNPLMQNVFSTFLQYLPPEVETSIMFLDKVRDKLQSLNDCDVAIVFAMGGDDQFMISSQTRQLIILNRKDDNFNYLTPDNYAGGRMMAEYLLECGHRDICCPVFHQEDTGSDFSRRWQGFSDVLSEAGIDRGVFFIEAGTELRSESFSKVIEHIINHRNISAIACMTDKIAMHIYSQSQAMNLKVPDDISVIGFDDQYYARFCNPPLTTVKYPAEAMGKRLADSLNHFFEHGELKLNETIMPVLIKRQSVKPFIKGKSK